MHQATRGNDRDDARPERHLIVDEDDVGALARGQNAAVSQAGRAGG